MPNKRFERDAVSLTTETQAMIRQALEQSWSDKTSVCFNPSIAPLSYGQCAPTTIVVFEKFGDEILRTEVRRYDETPIRHFYNRIAGQRYDFTADQFNIPDYWREVVYQDIPSTVSEATTEMLPGQLEAMRSAFAVAFGQEGNEKNG
jgi:hypothetical protein